MVGWFMDINQKPFKILLKNLSDGNDIFVLAVENNTKMKDYARERLSKIYKQNFFS